MPIYTEIVTTFKGKGSKKIHDWAKEGDGGVFLNPIRYVLKCDGKW